MGNDGAETRHEHIAYSGIVNPRSGNCGKRNLYRLRAINNAERFQYPD